MHIAFDVADNSLEKNKNKNEKRERRWQGGSGRRLIHTVTAD